MVAVTAGAANGSTLDLDGRAPGESVTIADYGSVATAEFGATLQGFRGLRYGVEPAHGIGLGASPDWTVLAPDSDNALLRAAWLVETFRPESETLAHASDEFALEAGGASSGVVDPANGYVGAPGNAPLDGFTASEVWVHHGTPQDQFLSGYVRPAAWAIRRTLDTTDR